MSYREKPILKLYKYENNSFILQAIIDDYQECSFEDNLYEAGQFSITINFNIPNSQLFQRGLFIQFGNSWKFGEITKIQDQIGEDGKGSQFRIITGFDARYILKRRVIKNMNSNGLWVMTGKGEIVLRNLINDQAGINAEEKRKLPIVNTIPDSETAIGKEYSVSEQFSNLYEVCKTIATQSEIGWRLEFNGISLNLVCFEGTDRTQTVQFSTSFDSLANGQFIDSSESFANAIYVGGKGQNDDRDIYEGESAIEGDSPAGLDRFESWDNQSSMTTESEYEAEALSMLNQYGQTLTMSGNGLAKCPYEYEKEYFVGDKIKIAFSGKSANAQILSVTEHWAFGAYEINFSFGKPLPDLNAQLQLMLRKIQTASNKTNSKDSVRWYTIPTDTAMPASDVTYNTIGFIGNVGSGATFTLYRDSSGTGSKTYHVYFKQLAGSGKLTLTTGVSGATDLVMNPGTYVAIIYVDENGNITSQGMTATNSIQTGNNQPATSGGVAGAIQDVVDVSSSLPTDAVLHYSFDDVPDYPDGTADVRFTDGNTYGLQSTNYTLRDNGGTTFSNVNGNVQAVITGGTSTGVYVYNTYIENKIVKFRIKVKEITGVLLILQGIGTGNTVLKRITEIEEYEIVYYHNNSAPYPSLYFLCQGTGNSCTFELLAIYIGNGSYSTPIIDNANGQNNSVLAQGFVTDKGVSGKGITIYNSGKKTIRVKWDSSNWDRPYTISCWVKVNNSNAYIVGWDSGYAMQNHFLRYNNTTKNIWFDVNENTRFIGYICAIDLDDGKWHSVVAINKFESGKSEIWIDGEKKTLTTQGRTVTAIQDYFLIGTSKAEQDYYNVINSQLDDFQLFDRALSEQEVQALYLNKANTPKYFPTPTNEIKKDSLELATSGGVYAIMNTTPNAITVYSDDDLVVKMQQWGKLAVFYVYAYRTVNKTVSVLPYKVTLNFGLYSTLIRGATVIGEIYFTGQVLSNLVVTSNNGAGQGQIVAFLE